MVVGQRQAPHFFQVIKSADFRPKKVNDRGAGIDQDPVALPHALDRRVPESACLQLFDDMLRHRNDLPGRSAACDEQAVGDVGLPFEIDNDDILRLIILERSADERFESFGGKLFLFAAQRVGPSMT